MRKIGIIVNITKDKNLEITRSIIKWIENKGGKVMLTRSVSSQLGKIEYGYPVEKIYECSDFTIVLGGDGTILGVAREIAEYGTPLLGVNLGHLGFLAEVELKDIFKSLEIAFNDDLIIEKRLMLHATLQGNSYSKSFYALNDIVITRGTISRLVTMKVFINDAYVTTLRGDGLIIASPTGSTAYSLSAGGPIISPDLSVIALTPICPHSLSTRSFVICGKETVRIEIMQNSSDVYLTIDGQEGYKIGEDEALIISEAPFTTNLIKILDRSFYDVLRAKLTER